MNKKAFTLVELMGVIIVLGLITLLIAPTILNQIRNSKDKIDNVTKKLIYSATDLYLDNKENEYPKLNGATYCLTLNNLVEDGKLSSPVLDSNGDEINLDRIIAVDVIDKQYNYRMPSTCDHVAGEKKLVDLATTSPTLGIDNIDSCAKYGVCEAGTAFAIKVNSAEIYKFYVLNDDGNTVTLIMNHNLGQNIPWISVEDYQKLSNNIANCAMDSCTDVGPVTAISYLKELTDTEWNNIPEKKYTYSGIAEDGQTRMYEDITENMRVRMLTYPEAMAAGCTVEGDVCPMWLYTNTTTIDDSSLPHGYWTSTAYYLYSALSTDTALAWHIDFLGHIDSGYDTDMCVEMFGLGVRPVIELEK